MRKRVAGLSSHELISDLDQDWLDLQQIATVEVTSEDANFPIESVFSSGGSGGWRASQKGEQHIRIIFDEPQSLRRIRLVFEEAEHERTQEFTIRWSSAADVQPKEILRQRWNFSPTGSTAEVEDYTIELSGVALLDLAIEPDISRGESVATLASWRLR